MLSIGADFAGYRVLDTLGSGGMGAVYLVENADLGRREALKVVSVAGGSGPEFEKRFINEARAAAGIGRAGWLPHPVRTMPCSPGWTSTASTLSPARG